MESVLNLIKPKQQIANENEDFKSQDEFYLKLINILQQRVKLGFVKFNLWEIGECIIEE